MNFELFGNKLNQMPLVPDTIVPTLISTLHSPPKRVSLSGQPYGECPCQIGVRCEQPEGLVITDKDYMKLIPILAHGQTQMESGSANVHRNTK